MTGINFNIQNSYAALYTMSPTQTNSTPPAENAAAGAVSRGEKLTLSAEAIALSQQSFEPADTKDETTLGSGGGIRPPEASTGNLNAAIAPTLIP